MQTSGISSMYDASKAETGAESESSGAMPPSTELGSGKK